jgi:hypothetical protein
MMEAGLACCGLNCDKCPVFIATANDDDTLRQKTAKEWLCLYADILKEIGIHELKPEDINCNGCRSERNLFVGCVNCPIRKCCKDKNITTCASCNEYESCGMLKGFYSFVVHQGAKDNLDGIRMGRS